MVAGVSNTIQALLSLLALYLRMDIRIIFDTSLFSLAQSPSLSSPTSFMHDCVLVVRQTTIMDIPLIGDDIFSSGVVRVDIGRMEPQRPGGKKSEVGNRCFRCRT